MHHPNPGAAIVRQWTQDREYFLAILANLSPEGIVRLAQAAVAFHRQHGSTITVDQQLAAWQVAAEREDGATSYPKTMIASNGHEVTIHSFDRGWYNGQRCYIVAFEGDPEDYFGSKAHANSVGVEYPTILNVGEFRGLTVVHFLPDTTHFPQYAAELDRLGDWPKP